MKVVDKIGISVSILLIIIGFFLKYNSYDDYYAYLLTGSICLIGFVFKWIFKRLKQKSV